MNPPSLKPYLQSFFRHNTGCFLLGLLATVLESASAVGVAWLIQQLLDRCTGSSDAFSFPVLLGISAALVLLYLGAIQLDRITTSRFLPKAMAQYQNFLFSRIARKNIAAFRKENTATYLSIIANDTKTVGMGLGNLFGFANSILTMLCAVCLMLFYSPGLTLAAVALSVLFFCLSLPASKKLVHAEQERSDCNEELTARFKDFLTGFSVVKSFRAEKEMAVLFARDVGKSAAADRKRRMADMMFDFTIDGGTAAARISLLLLGVFFTISGQSVSAGMVVAFVQLLDHVMTPMQVLPLHIADLRAAHALISKAANHLEQNVRDEGTDIPAQLREGVTLSQLSFAYEPDKPVLSALDYTFAAGKKYALVGGSGCGKSTLLHLLMGGAAYEGSVTLDGQELRTVSGNSLYDLASLISQNVFLFNATIFDNVTMFRQFPEEEVEQALARSGLAELVAQKGREFLCGENGCNLSGGEKQRISIARCLLRKTGLLLVDEATSALDKKTAAQVAQSILDLPDVTCIVVTHALDAGLLRQYDGILALKNGRIAEEGSFDALMEQKGYFYSLYTVSKT